MFDVRPPRNPAEWTAYYDLRWRVLRQPWGQPRGTERDEREAMSDHAAVWLEDAALVGVGRLHLNTPREAQIRFMAVEPDHRGAGVGTTLVEHLESLARGKGVERIVLQAREEVMPFYARLGYEFLEPGPTLFGTVRHVKMIRRLATTDPS